MQLGFNYILWSHLRKKINKNITAVINAKQVNQKIDKEI
jgi:hypothetical protein